MAIATTWIMQRYFLRNRVTKKVYLLRPKYAGGLMVFDWTLADPTWAPSQIWPSRC